MANPPGLLSLAVEIKRLLPLSALAGIEGDNSHVFGYHKAPNWLVRYGRDGAGDASLQGPLNHGFNLNYASAIDISYWAQHSLNITISKRVRAALKARDPRLFYRGEWVVAEYAGTLDGRVTWAFYTDSMTEQFGAWDSSHLDHNHISIHRKFCNNYAALKGIAAVMAGNPATTTDWFDMATKSDLEAVINDRMRWWLPRMMQTLRRGSGNLAFSHANSGGVVDGLGVKGDVSDDLAPVMALLLSLKDDVAALKTKAGI